MASLQTYYSIMPDYLQIRFSPADANNWVTWCNQMLEEISAKGLMPLITFETGAIVKNHMWINKPAGLRTLKRIFSPDNFDQIYRAEEVNNKYKLYENYFEDVTPFEPLSSFFTTTTITIGTAEEYEENAFANYLVCVKNGNWLNKSFVIASSGATYKNEGGENATSLTLMHEVPTAPTSCDVGGLEMYAPSEYLMIKWTGSYIPLTAMTDEVPIDDKYELRLVPAYLSWCAHKKLKLVSNETAAAKKELDDVFSSILGERTRQLSGQVKGRRLPGYER